MLNPPWRKTVYSWALNLLLCFSTYESRSLAFHLWIQVHCICTVESILIYWYKTVARLWFSSYFKYAVFCFAALNPNCSVCSALRSDLLVFRFQILSLYLALLLLWKILCFWFSYCTIYLRTIYCCHVSVHLTLLCNLCNLLCTKESAWLV